MKTEKLNYHLPQELIAQQPIDIRSGSRLLVLNRTTSRIIDSQFRKIGDFLSPGDCLVLNDTKVLPARFFTRRKTGAKLEGLFLNENSPGIWEVMIKGARKLKTGDKFYLKNRAKKDFCEATVLDKKTDGICKLKLDSESNFQTILNRIGFPPLPPYIKRGDDPAVAAIDKLRYQTIYAKVPGAVAAPTAGLHFTDQLIEQLKQQGIYFAYITLHVGIGTFRPITVECLDDHKMHPEPFTIDNENASIINQAKDKGGRIIAVGTTTVRTLESVAAGSQIKAASPVRTPRLRHDGLRWRLASNGASGQATLFIKPGYKFKIIDAMITNFHLPKSTLLALVAAFAGLEKILIAYKHAIQQKYRFYSYGDAMLII